MFVRVWEYAVPASNLEAFLAAYGANGAWVQLFRRSSGYAGTELYRSTDVPERFITVDRWANEADWESFLAGWGRGLRGA
jgi:heme-degrading monooxygenase HmoA